MRIRSKKQLPSWFNLIDYSCYESMSDDEIIYQLSCRVNAITVEEYKKHDFFVRFINKGMYVFKSEYDGITPVWKKGEIDKSKYLSKSQEVSPLSLRDINFLVKGLNGGGKVNIDGSIKEDFSDMYIHVSAIDPVSVIFDGLYCKVDLLKSDEIILSEFKNLLSKWREELDFPEQVSPIKNSWKIARDKLFSYKAIPFIDLMLWESGTGNKITNGVLAVSLFPDGEYDSVNIAQTIKPFINALMDNRTIEKFEHEISNK